MTLPGFSELAKIAFGALRGYAGSVVGDDNLIDRPQRRASERHLDPRRLRIEPVPDQLGDPLERISAPHHLFDVILLGLQREFVHGRQTAFAGPSQPCDRKTS